MILKAYSLLLKGKKLSRPDIIEAMNQNLCRCGSYNRIVDAIQAAAAELKGGRA
jgi:carbon-monoxide dehydrogenase small subunit